MRDSLLHDSGLGAAATISARVAERAAPGGRRARRACTGICLHACLLRAAARGGLPGMHWDLPACTNPAGWLAEVTSDYRIVVAGGFAVGIPVANSSQKNISQFLVLV